MAKRYGTIISKDLKGLRGYKSAEDSSESLWNELTKSFLEQCDRIIAGGVKHVYRQFESNGNVCSGQIDPRRTMNLYAARNIDYKVAARYYARTIDTFENRVIGQALRIILRRSSNISAIRKAQRILHSFYNIPNMVQDDYRSLLGTDISESESSRRDYALALPIAKAILLDSGIDTASYEGAFTMDSLFVNMSSLFENFIRISLRECLMGDYEVVDGNTYSPAIPLFDNSYSALNDRLRSICSDDQRTNKFNQIDPDIMLMKEGRVVLAADVKYKPIKGGFAAKREDIEQSVTYACRLGLSSALTIHPCIDATDRGLHYSGRIGHINIFCYCIYLGGGSIENEERLMANSVKALLTQV